MIYKRKAVLIALVVLDGSPCAPCAPWGCRGQARADREKNNLAVARLRD